MATDSTQTDLHGGLTAGATALLASAFAAALALRGDMKASAHRRGHRVYALCHEIARTPGREHRSPGGGNRCGATRHHRNACRVFLLDRRRLALCRGDGRESLHHVDSIGHVSIVNPRATSGGIVFAFLRHRRSFPSKPQPPRDSGARLAPPHLTVLGGSCWA